MSVEFVDTNILIYAFDKDAGDKRDHARELIGNLAANSRGCISAQVLMEFFVVATAKTPKKLTPKSARGIIESMRCWPMFSPNLDDILAASDIAQKYKINFWDAMIVRAAAKMGADILWTEDLNHGQMYEDVEVRNPFVS